MKEEFKITSHPRSLWPRQLGGRMLFSEIENSGAGELNWKVGQGNRIPI